MHLWDLTLINEYLSKASRSTGVESPIQCGDVFETQVEARQGNFVLNMPSKLRQYPKTYTLPRHSCISKTLLRIQSGAPVHMVNLLQFAGRPQYSYKVAAATPALGRCGAQRHHC